MGIPEIKKGNYYEIALKNGQHFETKCHNVTDSNISVLLNENVLVDIPKSKIDKVKRKKVSVFRLLGGLTVVTVGIIIYMNNTKEEPLPVANISN